MAARKERRTASRRRNPGRLIRPKDWICPAARLPLARLCTARKGIHLSGDSAAEADAGDGTDIGDEDAVLLFVGGPLDGRVEIRAARHGEPLPTVTHVHLHDGPKVVHRYDLQPLTEQAGVYHVRPHAPKSARDESVPD